MTSADDSGSVGPTTAGTELGEAIGRLPFFDHHAHLLAHPTAGYSLAEVLTEAPAVPQTPHNLTWLRAQRDLAAGPATARTSSTGATSRRCSSTTATGFPAR